MGNVSKCFSWYLPVNPIPICIYSPVFKGYAMGCLVLNLAAGLHMKTKKNSQVQQTIDRDADPSVPRMLKRHNPKLIKVCPIN